MSVYFLVSVSASFMYFASLIGVMSSLKVSEESISIILEWEVSEKLLMELSVVFLGDLVSCLFSSTVLFISGSVMLFSGFYMSHETFLSRFLALVFLFVLSMMILILFPNFVSLMVGWDGLGVVSFLLVIYYMNSESLSAGMITAISNRVGDVFFILLIGLMSSSMSFNFFSDLMWFYSVMGVLLILGSMTKSAQVPFSAWLPEAMAAPTPVSTLVHSSTLVTAGVYVLVRFGELLDEVMMNYVLIVSMVTVIMAGSSGLVEMDVKKVVALSTLSQVGMMMFASSMGAFMLCYFHLLVHAFFKALMFMCVGGIIFYSGGVQDARYLSGLWFKVPLSCSLLVLSNLSLMGFPFLSGFYSKELILGIYLVGEFSWVGFLLLFWSLVLTMGYSIRMMVLVMSMTGVSGVSHESGMNVFYTLSLIMMSGGAVFMGMVLQLMSKEMMFFVNMNVNMFYGSLVFIILFTLNSLALGYLVVKKSGKSKMKLGLAKMWFLKELSGNLISSKSLLTFSTIVSLVEMGWIRGYVWKGGMSALLMGGGTLSRKVNFNQFGLALCFSTMLWLMIMAL